MQFIGGLTADPTTGHIYIADNGNNRVVEFDAWGQFVKAWGWGVANGGTALQTCGPGATPPTATCQRGLPGPGPGQFSTVKGGVAIDQAGNVWVGDLGNHRIQKFTPDGEFLLMIGGQVDKGPNHPGNLCTAAFIAEGDTCGAGVVGGGNGEFETPAVSGSNLAIEPSGDIVVGDVGRIQRFATGGVFQGNIALQGANASKTIVGIAANANGDFQLRLGDSSSSHAEKAIRRIDPAGKEVSVITLPWRPLAIALDEEENLFVAVREADPTFGENSEVIEFDPAGKPLIALGEGFNQVRGAGGGVESVVGLATNTVTAAGAPDIYLTSHTSPAFNEPVGAALRAFGPPPDKWLPPIKTPTISAQYARSVRDDSAVVGAEINPHFWADVTYSVEYGTGKCSEGGCPDTLPVAPVQLPGGVINEPVRAPGITLPNLSPETTYHYRFIAQSSGGGPVRGVGAEEAEATFMTTSAAAPPPNTSCSNQVFRTGAAARLADCRAYEMVSPVDKNNTDITSLINIDSTFVMLNQSATSGDKLTYTTSQGFGDAQGTPYLSQYIASRTADGWQNHAVTPSQGLSSISIGHRIEIEFQAFTDDLCSGLVQHPTDPPLAPGAIEGYLNLYLRSNCGEEGYEAVTTSKPLSLAASEYLPEPQGLSADGRCAVFYAEDQLTPDADPVSGRRQLYESCGEGLRLVSALPSGKASTAGASVGTNNSSSPVVIRTATSAQAVSSDGSRVYWTAENSGSGALYVRVNAGQEQSQVSSGNCTEANKACTIKVSPASNAHFWGASADGSKAMYTAGASSNGELFEYDLKNRKSTLITAGVSGVMGVGGEASRVFFVSTKALTGANARGESPTMGGQNLYFYEGSEEGKTFAFVGTLLPDDVTPSSSQRLTPVNGPPYKKTSRLSPDGRHVAFMAKASLTGYDNIDAVSGDLDNEVFTYNSETEALHCVSCNPTGQRPHGRIVPMEGYVLPGNRSAASLPTYQTSLYGSRVISEDGSRVFFNSYEALLPRDTNGRADVYQWEAPDSGDCTTTSPLYSPPNGGCLSLISSGESASDSEFVDASPNGRDVFFATASGLVPQDTGLIDIYDARVGGGYPPPAPRAAACEGEACQGPLSPPNDPTPASSSFEGAGNVRDEKPTSRKSKKSARKQKKQKAKAKKQKKRAEHKRRATR